MSVGAAVPADLIWATRGKHWGFRFLLDAGLLDPLPEYERVVASIGDDPLGWSRVEDASAVRFPDPIGRRDAAGRVIPHEFVILGERAQEIHSAAEGIEKIWPIVAAAYERVWDFDSPPVLKDLRFDT